MNRCCTYLLPIRRTSFCAVEVEEFRDYFAGLQAAGCEVIVVEGSAQQIFERHHDNWSNVCRHKAVDPRFRYLNDKVNGLHTGISLATSEKVILADDDIRYRPGDVEKINRATLRIADYPGTCAFRRSTILNAGEYDGDVLLDNEEIIRHFARAGSRICYANNFFIHKRPSKFRKWLEQRPRQAYEDFELRFKTILFASVLPIALAVAIIDIRYMSIFLLSILLAAVGWARGNARKYFPFNICFFAPFWIFERAFSAYWAFYWFLTRGGYPFGNRLLSKGTGRDWIEGGKIAARE